VVQVVVDGWYKAGLGQVWIGGVGLAVIYYLLPKLLNRPLHSRALANLGFWTTLFFAGWNVVSPAAPVPAWIASASTAGALLLLIPTLAFAVNVSCTSRGALEKGLPRAELLFVFFASAAYVAAAVLSAWGAKRGVAEVVRLTFFGNAQQVCLVYGVGVMSLMAAIAFLVPKLLGLEEGAFRLLAVQFWSSAVGVVLLVFVFTFGGLQLGRAINNPALGYADITAMDHSSLAAGALGVALVLAGQIVLALQLFGLIGQGARQCFCKFAADALSVGGKPAGAKV
jgi:cytochrome c oxidase cbb3-type subunit 1